MTTCYRWIFLLPLLAGLSGCSPKHEKKKDAHDHGKHSAEAKEPAAHDDHGAEASGASYQEGKGISMSEETRKSLGLEVMEVGEQVLTPTIALTGQIYRASSEPSRTYGKERSGNAYATALISRELVDKLAVGQKLNFLPQGSSASPQEGTVWKIDSAQMSVLGKAEALLELRDAAHALAVGAFVEAKVPIGKEPRKMIAIPRSALLEASTGRYAFVQNGSFLLRTEIKTGAQTDDFVEVTEGLYEGDNIAVKPVEALYLIELRATKGGGHSH
jgi:hypothetical protein